MNNGTSRAAVFEPSTFAAKFSGRIARGALAAFALTAATAGLTRSPNQADGPAGARFASAFSFEAHAQLRVESGGQSGLQASGKVHLSQDMTAEAREGPVGMIVVLENAIQPNEARSKAGLGRMRSEAAAATDNFLARVDAGRWLGRDRTAQRIHRRYEHAPFIAMRLSLEEANRLAADPGVRGIVEDRAHELQLVGSVPVIQAPQVWALGPEGAGTSVAVLDTGVDIDHSMFAGKIVGSACFSTTNSSARTLCPNGTDEQIGGRGGDDCEASGVIGCDHGTHVAGIAVGRSVSTTSGTTYRGVAPSAGVVALNVFSGRISDNKAVSFSSDQIAAFDWLLPQVGAIGLASINMSLGGSPQAGACDSDPLKFYVDQMRAAGVVTVIAAGNDSSTVGVSSPGCISSAVTVGATNNSDAIASFSNVGPLLDLMAPGSSIVSAIPAQRLGTKSGTSMATPHVAGAFALLKSAVPGATVDQIETALKSSGVAITDTRVTPAIVTPRINVLAALQALGGATPQFVTVTPDSVASFTVDFGSPANPASRSFTITNPGTGAVTVEVTSSSGNAIISRGGQVGSPISFQLAASASDTITVAPNTAGLPFGIASANIRFSVSGGAATTRGVRIDVKPPISVTPTAVATLIGPAGGPFRAMENIDGATGGVLFALNNSSPSAVDLTIASDQTWLSMAAGGASGQSINFAAPSGASSATATASATANGLSEGTRRATATFTGAGATFASVGVDLRVTTGNDFFANATTVPPRQGQSSTVNLSVSGNSTNSWFEVGEPAHFTSQPARRSIWYKFVSPITGQMTIDTSGSSFDTLLAAYTGGAIGSLTQLASNDDASGLGLRSRVTINVTAGQTYYAAVDGFNGASGAVTLNVGAVPPAHNTFAQAVTITGASGSTPALTHLASSEASEPPHVGETGARSVWYRWTSPGAGVTTFSTTGNDHDTLLAVYAGTNLARLTEVAANDDQPGGSNGASSASFMSAAGQVYHIAVAAKASGSGGLTNLTWSQTGATTPLLASTSPASRSTSVGRDVTVFANILNNSGATVSNCSVAKPASFTGSFSYQTASAANQLTGSPNTPAPFIAPGAVQNFVLTAASTSTLAPSELGFRFVCDGVEAAPVFIGVNTWLLQITPALTPDIIAIGATQGTPGVITLPTGGSAAFAVAAVNIGSAAAASTLRFEGVAPNADVATLVCETNPGDGQCKATPAANVIIPAFAVDEVRTFTIFVQNPTSNAVTFNPAVTRVFARFVDSSGNVFGSTSAAVRTQ